MIDYGNFLEKNIGEDIDHITIHSNEYWKAFFTMTPNDPNVFFARIFLLLSKGYLRRAEYTRGEPVFNMLLSHLQTIKSKCWEFVEQGIVATDKGENEKAVAFYKKALEVYPFSPQANYEMGLTVMLSSLKSKENILKSPAYGYYEKVRKYDPFFHLAYQGENKIARKMLPIMETINPMLELLASRKITVDGLKKFAEACFELGEYEFAAYANFKIALDTFDKTKGFNIDIIKEISKCIAQLGAEEAAAFVIQQIQAYNQQLNG